MATVLQKRDEQQYGKLMGMIQPEATPTKRIGTETPTGAVTAGPAAGKSAAEFTQTQRTSPGSVFSRQLGGADISGITKLAEQPLLREAGEEARRVAGEGLQYKKTQEENLGKQAQLKDFGSAVSSLAKGEQEPTGTAQTILQRTEIPVSKLDIADVREFTPQQAIRGGTVESLLRKEATGPYTTGMAGLDALLFAKKGGAGQLAERGTALRATEQAAADALEKSATEEAQRKAKELVEGQRTGLVGALTGELGSRKAGYESGLEAVRSGRAAAAGQAYQDMLQNYVTQAGLLRGQVLNELVPPELQTATGGPEVVEGVDVNNLPAAPAEIQVPNRAAIEQALQGVDINQLLSKYIQPGQINAPTLADVAAGSPEKQKEYERLTNLLKLAPGQDVSGYGLGQTTTPFAPGTSAPPEAIKQAIIDAFRKAGMAVPKQTIKTGANTGATAFVPGQGMVSSSGGTTRTR